jgi:predicted permease
MSAILRTWRRLLMSLRGNRLDRELQEEMEQHLEHRVRDAVSAGMSEDEARGAAARRLGGMLRARESSRDVWGLTWLVDLAQDIRFGTRLLRRNPGFAVAAVLLLAFGIGGNSAIFGLLDSLVYRRLPVTAPDELVLLGARATIGTGFGVQGGERTIYPYRDYQELRARQQSFTGVAAVSEAPGESNVRVDGGTGNPERATGTFVSGNYFDVLGVGARIGRTLTAADDTTAGAHPVVVISHDYWTRRFSRDERVLGRTIGIGRAALVIVGVAAAGFNGDHVARRTDFWIPLSMQGEVMPHQAWLDEPMALWLRLVGRLRPGESITHAQTGVNVALQQILAERAGSLPTSEARRRLLDQRITLTSAATGVSSVRNRFAGSLSKVMGMVALVLLLACTNLATMLLARASARLKELGLRLALGASRSRVLRQLLTESLVLSVLGAATGVAVARFGGQLLLRMASGGPDPIPLALPLDGRVLGFTLAVTLVSTLLVGLVPALSASRSNPSAAIRGETGIAGVRRIRLPARKVLVSAQVALTLVLLVSAGLLVATLRNLRANDLGFDRRVLQIGINGVNSGYTEARSLNLAGRLTESMKGVGGVSDVAVSDNGLLTNSGSRAPVTVFGDKPRTDDERFADFDLVSDGYFHTLGVRMVSGREFTGRDRQGAPRVAIVNESFARYYFGESSAVGRQFSVDRPGREGEAETAITIVGVASDARNQGPREAAARQFYLSYYQAGEMNPGLQFQLRLSASPEVVGPLVRAAIRRIDPTLDIESMESLDTSLERLLVRDRLMANLAGAFGVLAMLLAATGLYGVLAYTVARRSREIGIRMALGARRAEIVRLVVWDGGVLIVVGTGIGIPAALLVARGLSTQLFGLTAFSPTILAASVLVLLTVATAAAMLPARQATRVDPLVAIRSE